MTEQALNIPPNWVEIKLGDIIELAYGKNLPKEKRNTDGKYPVYGSNGIVGYHDQYLITGPAIIVGRKGAAGIPTYAKEDCWPIDTTYFIQPKDAYDLQFVYHLIKHLRLDRFDRSTAIPGLNRDDAYALNINLPPLNEQKRIVAKIEELFSELDKGIESLKTVREQLKVYRQAVLKHAFEGKLTVQWREQNKDKLETADQLLSRMQAKRFGDDNLPILPSSWVWLISGELFSMVTSGSRGWAKYYSDSGALFIRIGNLDFDSLSLDLSDLQHVSLPGNAEGLRTRVQEGDFLFSITGYLGMFAIAPKFEEAYVNQHIALARPFDGFNREYVGYYITSHTGGRYYLNGLTKGAVKAGLRLDDIRSFPVPMCSLAEQEKVVEDIKKKLSVIENIEQTIAAELQRSGTLRQCILKKAFSGKLVAQDPNDEPASVLLERIRAEKEAQSGKREPKQRQEPDSILELAAIQTEAVQTSLWP